MARLTAAPILARQYAESDPLRVRYLDHSKHRNRGISASRNLGVRHALGEYLAFLDSDDVWDHAKLKQQVSILDAHPRVDFVYGSALIWYSWSQTPEAKPDYVPEMGMPLHEEIPAMVLLTRLLQRQAHCPPSRTLAFAAARSWTQASLRSSSEECTRTRRSYRNSVCDLTCSSVPSAGISTASTQAPVWRGRLRQGNAVLLGDAI